MDEHNLSPQLSSRSSSSSDMTTPHSLRHAPTTLAKEMRSKLVADYDKHTDQYDGIRKWIQQVFKLTDEHLRQFDECVEDGRWSLDAGLLADYSALLLRRETLEPALYAPFQHICNTFIKQVETTLPEGLSLSDVRIRFWHGNGDKQLKSDTAVQCKKPDIMIVPKSILEDPLFDPATSVSWGRMMFPMEVKRSKPPRKYDPFYRVKVPANFKTLSPPSFRSRKTKKDDPRLMPHKPLFGPPSAPTAMPTLSQKRLRSDESSDEDEDGPSEVKRVKYTQKDAQLGTYVTEMTLAVYRFFGIGLALHNDRLKLWCYDCMGAFSTIDFNFVTDTKLSMLVLFAMSLCSPTDAGYNPFHKSKDGGYATEWEGSYFCFSGSTGQEFKYLVEGDAPLFIAREILHRRTIVLPVHTEEEVDTPLALKFSWINPLRRRPETDTIRDILALAPELAPYLPHIDFSRLYDSENDLHLPRFALNPRLISTPRHLLASVAQRFSPLWEVNNLEEFKRAFIHVVECHHRTYMTGRVLHRDISEGNVMFYRVHDEVNGVLLDFDNASRVDHKGDVITSGAQQRTGTAPFMAHELLSTEHSPHLYRHDLESFLYFLIWAAMHFDLPQKRRLPINPILKDWNAEVESQFRPAKHHKVTFLITKESASQICTECRPEFKPLVETWIMPLRSLFRRAVLRLSDEDMAVEDIQTLDGLITFETFMKALGVQPRKWV